MPRCGDAAVQECWGAGVRGCWGAGVRGCRDAGMPGEGRARAASRPAGKAPLCKAAASRFLTNQPFLRNFLLRRVNPWGAAEQQEAGAARDGHNAALTLRCPD